MVIAKDLVPTVLRRAVVSGEITIGQAKAIMSYPKALERALSGTSVKRCATVACAWLTAEIREMEGRPPKHFSRYHPKIIEALPSRIGHSKKILDPMAGTLERLSILERPDMGYHLVHGVEIECKWVEGYPHPRLIQGDARKLPYENAFFDCIIVSPSYGNRDADRTGEWWDNDDRKTYAAALRANPDPASLCVPFHRTEYKLGHALAWSEAVRVLKVGGLFVINLKNTIKSGVITRMSQWHRDLLRDELGLKEIDDTAVPTRGRMSGANYDLRAEDAEKLYIYCKLQESSLKAKALRKAIKKEIKNNGKIKNKKG